MDAGGRSRGHRGAHKETAVRAQVHLDGGVASAVDDLAGGDTGDRGHGTGPRGTLRRGRVRGGEGRQWHGMETGIIPQV